LYIPKLDPNWVENKWIGKEVKKMKRNQLVILMIAVVAIGLFALPSTFSYAGSMHTFKQIDPTSPATINLFCAKCHAGNVQEQLNASDRGLYQGSGKIHASVGCEGCHQITRSGGPNGYNNGAFGYGQTSGAESIEHAARLPTCLDCHIAGAELIQWGDAGTEIRAPTEAHKNFKFATDNDLECIGCHTEVTRTGMVTTSFQSAAQTFAGVTIG
jgi:Cytochrome c554 and c-prime